MKRETFTLQFSDKIGGNVTLSDKSEYYCGDYISGRYYSGKFGGSFYKPDGIYFMVDKELIKLDVTTQITFDK